MAKKINQSKNNSEYHKQQRRNQIIFGFVAVILILSMSLSLISQF
jgi:hypothetical protein